MRIGTFYLLSLTLLFACKMHSEKSLQKKFNEAGNTAVFTTKFVLEGKVITRVDHYLEDGSWQFLSSDHFDNFEDVAKIVGLGEIVKMDSSVLEVADMKAGYSAHRDHKGDNWVVEK